MAMDCKQFRKQHLCYLDDTLSGEDMAAAQYHVMHCDACAAHDALVRRSLMLAHSLPCVEPSLGFEARMRERLNACRAERAASIAKMAAIPEMARLGAHNAADAAMHRKRASGMLFALAACAVLGAVFLGNRLDGLLPGRSMQTAYSGQSASPGAVTSATPPAAGAAVPLMLHQSFTAGALLPVSSVVTPALMQAMATGNPIWSAAMMMEDSQMQLLGTDYYFELH